VKSCVLVIYYLLCCKFYGTQGYGWRVGGIRSLLSYWTLNMPVFSLVSLHRMSFHGIVGDFNCKLLKMNSHIQFIFKVIS
jgi:hypothetical protein